MVSETLPSTHEHKRDEIIKKLRDFFHEDVFFSTMCELASTRSELTVFCHGDCWTNNILFAENNSANIEASIQLNTLRVSARVKIVTKF